MALLLYKSNEMFSVTELIRKSKNIFDKIVNDEIEKAIILRDGKPGFLLMDFEKYEKIMADYEELKLKSTKSIKQKKIKKQVENKLEIDLNKIEKVKEEDKEDIVVAKQKLAHNKPIEQVIPPRPAPETIQVNRESEVSQKEEPKKENIPKELNEQEELNEALDKIKNISLNDEERQRVESQIKERIKKARAQREKLSQEAQKIEKEDLKEELELQVALKEKNQKKARELKEFWD